MSNKRQAYRRLTIELPRNTVAALRYLVEGTAIPVGDVAQALLLLGTLTELQRMRRASVHGKPLAVKA